MMENQAERKVDNDMGRAAIQGDREHHKKESEDLFANFFGLSFSTLNPKP